jgi:DNA-binding Lrp family transcriptional regulator
MRFGSIIRRDAQARKREGKEQESRHRTSSTSPMLETAYVLIRLERNTPAEVARQVRRVSGVAEAAVTMGEVDVLAIVREDSTKGIAAIRREIEAIEGVGSVSVCVVVRP